MRLTYGYKSRLSAVTMIALAIPVACDTGSDLAEIHLAVVDGWLKPLPYRVLTFRDTKRSIEYSSRFDDELAAKRVPFGSYEYVLVRKDVLKPSASTVKGRIVIAERRVLTTLLPPNPNLTVIDGREMLGDGVTLKWCSSGRFERIPTAMKRLWARLVGLPTGQTQDLLVSSSGDFEICAAAGHYIITLIGDDNPLQSTPLSIGPSVDPTFLRIECCNAVRTAK